MKLNFNIQAGSQRSQAGATKAESAQNLQPSTFNLQPSQRGIALIITLILLSVTLVMAVAFLAISRRESGSVTTSSDTTAARLAADSALANAEAQIIANVFADTNAPNPYNFGLFVSTNYINANGFDSGVGGYDPTNINYDFLAGGRTLNQGEFLQNVANLLYLPRPPVFIVTNQQTGASDFRYYLDLNRNGKFEASGLITNVDDNNKFILDANGNPVADPQVGDPQWIGVLEHPDAPHGPNNKFIARYAFIAVPADGSLDLNYIHNQALNQNLSTSDGYYRNQGVGTWEINLAAFLADLNSDEWGQVIGTPANGNATYYYYQYNPNNVGVSFADAFSLLSYRYNYKSLPWLSTLLPSYQLSGSVDMIPLGPTMTGTLTPFYNYLLNNSWPGADNTNHFFDLTSDLFDTNKSSPGFVDRLLDTGTNTFGGTTASTYDRYTYYRMLAQLGTDSSAESGKMNLNYDNLDPGFNGVLNINGTASVTNFVPWTAIGFFTNAADRMLRLYTTNWFEQYPSNYLFTYYGITYTPTITVDGFGNVTGLTNEPFFGLTNVIPAFGITNIPVYWNGQFVYRPAVQRLLQLAANIYDASTNSFYPSVFRPYFYRDTNDNLFVGGYTNVDSVAGVGDMTIPIYAWQVTSQVGTNVLLNVYDVPWIIGAKKGFPNFNEFSMENVLGVTRRLQLTRTTNSSSTSTPVITATNQMYTMSLNSSLGAELWNSYNSNYFGSVTIGGTEYASLTITNDDLGFHWNPLIPMTFSTNFSFQPPVPWPGLIPLSAGSPNANSFKIPLNVTMSMLTNAVYRSPSAGAAYLPAGFSAPSFVPTNYFTTLNPLLFETNSPNGFRLPQFGLLLTNRLQVFMLDETNGIYHVIDYVQFGGPNGGFNVNSNLADVNTAGVWNTNPADSSGPTAPTYGIENQIDYSKGGNSQGELYDGAWNGDPSLGSLDYQETFFRAFFKPQNKALMTTTGASVTNLQLSVQAPYSPTRYIVQYITWQANDPLVHYLASDLSSSPTNPALESGVSHYNSAGSISNLTSVNLGQLNDHYMPWGAHSSFDPNAFNIAERDPLRSQSDDWDFPTSKYPSIGWLGRVHRGTPWQTVYLKAAPINLNTWAQWTGDSEITFNQYFDAANSTPTSDRLLFDLFTTAPNDNATHGQLSVNVGAAGGASLAAWSAALSGIVVPTNSTVGPPVIIPPAGSGGVANSMLGQIVADINATRADTNFVNLYGLTNTFEHVGDILRVPQLSILTNTVGQQSPFLDINTTYSDEMYEWLPQQMMSLVRDSSAPRYVIYCYGQTLKPAPNGIVTSGGFFGMVTNYQVVAETATRAVVRVDNANTPHPHVVIESFNLLPPD